LGICCKIMKPAIVVFLLSIFTSLAQGVFDDPIRMVGTNYFDFSPLIGSFQRQEISSSSFLVFGEVTQIDGNSAQVIHKELHRQLTEDFKKQMLLASPSDLLKMSYTTQVLDRWRSGQLSAGEFMSFDGETKQIIVDEIEREKQDFYSVAVLVVNLPQNYLLAGKQVRLLALPIVTKPTEPQSLPKYDYGQTVNEATNNFAKYFFVTANGFVKKKIISVFENSKTNPPILLKNSSQQNSQAP
jgi:hypothetical protein